MSIKQKLYLLGITAISCLCFSLISFSFFENRISDLKHANYKLAQMEISLLNLRRNEKDFLLRMDEKYLNTFENNTKSFLAHNNELVTILSIYSLPSTQQLITDLSQYENRFLSLAQAYKKLGLNNSSGQLGQILLEIDSEIQKAASDQLLLELKHLKEIIFLRDFQEYQLLHYDNPQLDQLVRDYFAQLGVIGTSFEQGLLGETRSASHVVEKQFKQFSDMLSAEIMDQTQEINNFKYFVIVLTAVMLIALLFWVIRDISKKVSVLSGFISNVTNSNDLTLRNSIKGKDEFSRIAHYFNQLLDVIHHPISLSKHESKDLTQNTVDMNAQLSSLVDNFKIQTEQTNMMATATEQIAVSINDIAHNTTDTVKKIQIASESAGAGQQTLKSTISGVRELSETLSSSMNTVSALNRNVSQIVNTMTLIQEIAEQTNLLSLNAAIEAARAGEQGRGFAVVADEVRALSKRTSQSTEEIRQIITSIEVQMENVVTEISECTERSVVTANESLMLEKSLQEIQQNMDTITGKSQIVSDSINEQENAISHLSQSITQLTQISEDNFQEASKCLSGTEDVKNQAIKMNDSVSVFRVGEYQP